jgi:hypothetical protein
MTSSESASRHGLRAADAIDHVGTSHIWTKTDIQQVQDADQGHLRFDISFDDIPDLWKQSIIDDINKLSNKHGAIASPTITAVMQTVAPSTTAKTSVYSNGPPQVSRIASATKVRRFSPGTSSMDCRSQPRDMSAELGNSSAAIITTMVTPAL